MLGRLAPEEYERLALQCERQARLTRLTEEREFYIKQAALFRKLKIVRSDLKKAS